MKLVLLLSLGMLVGCGKSESPVSFRRSHTHSETADTTVYCTWINEHLIFEDNRDSQPGPRIIHDDDVIKDILVYSYEPNGDTKFCYVEWVKP